MPSLIQGYEYDIFISYRHKDNKSDHWVTEFVRTLRSELEATFKEDISIYFDENPHDGLLQHHEVDDSLREKLRCLVFIPIVSQTYCDPKAFAWQHELLAFIKLATDDKLGLKTKVGGGNTASRVLPVRIHEVDTADKKLFEEATGGIMRPIDFIYKESGVNRPLRPSDERGQNQEKTDYRNQVNKVANAIRDIITGLQGVEEIPFPTIATEEKSARVSPVQAPKAGRKWKLKVPEFNKVFALQLALMATLVALITVTTFHFSEPPPDARVYRYVVSPPENTRLSVSIGGQVTLSPDGRLLAFVATDSMEQTRLWVRQLHALTAQALNGTEGATFPFWSPDSRFIGFFAGGKLKKIDYAGGPPQTLCDAPEGRGGTWNDKGTIVFNPSGGASPLFRVSAAGGTAMRTTSLDTSLNQYSHRWPYFLPDGEHFIYSGLTVAGGVGEKDAVFLGSLDTTFIPRVLSRPGSSAAYANGHLLLTRQQILLAKPFDARSLQTTGDEFPIAEDVHLAVTNKSSFSVSQNGILAYQTGGASMGAYLLWHDKMGKRMGAIDPSSAYNDLRLSPDGKRIVISQLDEKSKTEDIWLYEISRAIWTRFTFDPASDRWPVWSPAGSSIVFSSNRKGRNDLYLRASSGAGTEELLLESKLNKRPSSWSRDGQFLAYDQGETSSSYDIWVLPMNPAGERKPFPFLQTEFSESRGTFSPDGRWIAYQSIESGENEIYIRPFPGPGGKWQVSANGGTRPRWSSDGKELFYLGTDGKVYAAVIKLGSTSVDIGSVRPLFQARPYPGGGRENYDVSADGQRFLVMSLGGEELSRQATVVVNWPEEVKK